MNPVLTLSCLFLKYLETTFIIFPSIYCSKYRDTVNPQNKMSRISYRLVSQLVLLLYKDDYKFECTCICKFNYHVFHALPSNQSYVIVV